MKLVTYNIQYGIGRDGRFDLDRITGEVREADIIAFQEVTQTFSRNGHVDMVADLRERLPAHFSVFGAAMDVDTGSSVIEGRAIDRRLTFGNMVFSRFPILAARNLLLPRTRTLDMLNLQRGAMEALIDAPGGALRVYSVHLDHVSADERLRQIDWLKAKAAAYPLEGGALTGAAEFGAAELPHPDDFVLMGDFNMEPESDEYCAMVGRDNESFGRPMRFDTPSDAALLVGGRPDDAYSWIDLKDQTRRKHLDYCFVSAAMAARIEKCWTDYEAAGSDHLPVWVQIADSSGG